MASQFTLTPIRAKTKGEVKRLRKTGFTPVSLQHKGADTLHYQQETRPLDEYIRQYGDAAMIDLFLAPDSTQRAIVKDIQRDPFTQKLLQVTYQLVRHDDLLKTHVSIVFQGEEAHANNNEVMMQHQVNRLDIECEQRNLPDHILVDISHLGLGDVMRVSDLPANPLYKILTAPNTVLASLASTRFGKEPETTETVETAPDIE
jgi:large subunit ribosomal protein L25